MTHRFNPPPGWPHPPEGWAPPAGWTKDAAWPPAPPGWNFWVSDEGVTRRSNPIAVPQVALPTRAPGVLQRKTSVSYAKAGVVTVGALLIGTAVGVGGANGTDASAIAATPTSRPSVSISVKPGPTVTVMATPAPAPTVTVTAKPVPAPTVTITRAPATKAPATKAVPFVAPPPAEDSSAYYSNCAAARNAGVAPLRRGDAGYRSGLDRDNDGLACE